MAPTDLCGRVEAVADRPPLCEMSAEQWRELRAELDAADAVEDLPGKWQAAVLAAEGAEAGGGCCHGV